MDSEIKKTLHRLDEDIEEGERLLEDTEKCLEKYPQSNEVHTNYIALKHIISELKSRREELLEVDYDIRITEKIRELFNYTQHERFMGGKLKYVQVSPDNNYILVESEFRMGANMMQTLMAMTDSKIILGTENNNVLVFKRNKKHESDLDCKKNDRWIEK